MVVDERNDRSVHCDDYRKSLTKGTNDARGGRYHAFDSASLLPYLISVTTVEGRLTKGCNLFAPRLSPQKTRFQAGKITGVVVNHSELL